MNLKVYIICVAAAMLLALPAAAGITATIHGEVYGWDTFEPLENAVIEVNSTPSQSMVAKYGVYSFELEPGDYLIKAGYYQNGTLIYSAEEPIKIKGEGSYVLDLLLLPVYSEELMESSNVKENSENPEESENSSTTLQTLGENSDASNISDTENSGAVNASIIETSEINGSTPSTGYYLIAVLALFLLLAGGYTFVKNRSIEKNKPENHKPEKTQLETDKPEKNRLSEEKVESQTVESQKAENQIIEDQINKLSVPVNAPAFSAKVPAERTEQKKEQELPVKPVKTQLSEASERGAEPETPAAKKNLPLPADLQEIMDIVRGQGGRITQKDLRSKLKYSEGKVSLMLADLERRELIEKFKRGRGNIVILREEKK